MNFPEWNAQLQSVLGDELIGTRVQDGQSRDWASLLFREGRTVDQAVAAIRSGKEALAEVEAEKAALAAKGLSS